MSLKIDRVQLEIVINNDQARTQLRALDDEAKKLTKEMKGLDKTTADWAQKSTRLKSIKVQMDGIYESIGITNMTMKELTTRQRDLNGILLNMRPGTEEYKKLKAEATAVTQRIGELRGKAKETGTSIKGMADGFNRYFGMFTAFAASITGVVLGFRKLANDVAAMDDVYSDVMKTTGLTRDAVVGLNDTFKEMDTRTARESLNMLARDAGKLGINGTKDILDFVEAGNQINVALGEDLGDDAIKNIGKMVGVYKDASVELQNLGLKEQMLAVGSAVNQLGASSTASEPYLVAFAGRMGGIAKQANISMSAILGFGSALDQDMQAVEMSATALQKFIMTIMGDPAKFAKIAGVEVKAFSNLLRTDANAAIIQVLKAMNEKGGFQEMIPIFKEMGLDGARAVGVLSSMAGSIDKVTEAQKIANQSMIEASSVTDEYNIKNNNLNAQLDKAKKNFQEKALILGESLAPALVMSTNSLSYLIKALVSAPEFYRKNEVAIISLIGAFLALQSAKIKVIAASIWEQVTLQAGIGLKIKDAIVLRALIIQEQYRLALIGKTTVAQKVAAIATATWKSALVALGGPLGLVILAVTGLVAAIKLYDKYNSESIRLEQIKQTRIRESIELNNLLTARYNAQQTAISGLNKLNGEQIVKLKSLTESTIKQAEAELLVAKTRQVLTQKENTKTTLWQDLGNWASSKDRQTYEDKSAITAAENGKKAAQEMDESIKELSISIGNLKNQRKELTDIVNAEKSADAINATTKTQLEEKARLLGIALKNVAIDSEDYVRISKKLEAVNKTLNKTTTDVTDDNKKLATSYEKLGKEIDKYKTKLIDLLMAGKFGDAKLVGNHLAQLENQKKVIDGIVKAGGDINKFLDELVNSDQGLLEEQEELWEKFNADPKNKKTIDDYNASQKQKGTDKASADISNVEKGLWDQDQAEIKKQAKQSAYLDGINSLSGAAFDIWRNNSDARLDYELNNLNRAMEAELSVKNLTETQKDAIRAKYAKKESKLKEDAFKKQKAADVIQSIIKTALAVVNQLSGGDPVSAIPRSIAAGIAGLAETAVILAQPVPQFGKGRYNVIGADDGRSYNAAYTGRAETKIYTQPSLVAEQGAELIVDARTTRNLMMNYPGIIEAIYAARVPQRAEGNLGGSFQASGFDSDTIKAIRDFTAQLKQPVRGKWVLYDLEKSQQKLTDIETESTF